jgi:hypothetical protein
MLPKDRLTKSVITKDRFNSKATVYPNYRKLWKHQEPYVHGLFTAFSMTFHGLFTAFSHLS